MTTLAAALAVYVMVGLVGLIGAFLFHDADGRDGLLPVWWIAPILVFLWPVALVMALRERA